MSTSLRAASVLAVVVVVVVLASACKKDAPPAAVPPPPPAAQAAAQTLAQAGVAAAAAVDAGAAKPVPDFPIDTVPQGPVPKTSPVLEKFLASPRHQRIVKLVVPMLKLLDAGQCAKAVESAKDLTEAIRDAGADFKLTMDVKSMARKIQDDPNFMDRPYMNYKSVLVGLAVGIDLAPLTVQLSAKVPKALAKACEGFAKLLRDIRTEPVKAPPATAVTAAPPTGADAGAR